MTASSLRNSSTFVAESSHVLLPVLTLFRLSIRSFPFEVLSRMELDWSVLMLEDSFAGEFLIFRTALGLRAAILHASQPAAWFQET